MHEGINFEDDYGASKVREAFWACSFAGALYSPSEHDVTSVLLLNAKNSFF